MEFLLGLKEDGLDPQALRDRPVLDLRQAYFNGVFQELSDSRGYSAGGTPLAIPISEIKSYFEMFYIMGVSDRETHLKMIRAMDRTYVKVLSDRAAQQTSSARPQTDM